MEVMTGPEKEQVKKEPLISVIVPIYKVEDYLRDCVNSILAQSYENLEVFLVDDGSPDGCGAICDEYAEKDSRIRVIHKENGGLSDARNAGIDICHGEWIVCVDSDDMIHPAMIRTLYEAAWQTGAPMAWCAYADIDEKGHFIHPVGMSSDKITHMVEESSYSVIPQTWQEAVNCLYEPGELPQQMVVAWNKIYRRDLYDADPPIRFPKGKIFEDSFTTYRLMQRAGSVTRIDVPLCLYRHRDASTMKLHADVTYTHILEASEQRMLFYRDLGEQMLYKKELNMTMYYILRVYQVNKGARKDLKAAYRRFYHTYFKKESWPAAKRLRIASFLIGNGPYRFLTLLNSLLHR